jgi:hypothetical protein
VRFEIAVFGESTARFFHVVPGEKPFGDRGFATIFGTPDLRTVDAALFGRGESNASNLTVSHDLAVVGLMKPIG